MFQNHSLHTMSEPDTNKLSFTSDDGSVRVVAMSEMMGSKDDKQTFKEIVEQLNAYKWRDEDFLLVSYPKNG